MLFKKTSLCEDVQMAAPEASNTAEERLRRKVSQTVEDLRLRQAGFILLQAHYFLQEDSSSTDIRSTPEELMKKTEEVLAQGKGPSFSDVSTGSNVLCFIPDGGS